MTNLETVLNETKEKFSHTKYKGRFSDFRVDFDETLLKVTAVFNGGSRRLVNTIGYFYVPTAKGYLSAEWKKSEFNKTFENVDQSFLDIIAPFEQDKSPSVYSIYKGERTTVAHAIMHQINDAGSMLEEYSKLNNL
jgi:hypothetical protein